MSFNVATTTAFPQTAFQYFPYEILDENAFEDFPILGGILSDLKHIWQAKGPCLEVRSIVTGRKVGAWTFGGILRDSNTKILAVEELKRAYGRVPLLVVGLNCSLSGGLICIFDIFGSKVLRVVQIGEQITNIHVIDSACDLKVLPETSPLKYFDGIVGIGTLGGNVFLLDICKQICENAIQNMDISVRDEVNPCQMVIVKKEKMGNIKKYVERSMEREEHLAIHLNVVLDSLTEHFILKGENGEVRVHVNQSETEISALFYSPQLSSLLVGYNFGAFQLWDLRLLELLYTSPICEGNIPVTHFTVQEPADDPKAYCYIWVSYSHNLLFHSGLPFAVMYSFYFNHKNHINGYGNLYEDFQHCSIRFQLELGDTQASTCKPRIKGGTCLGLQCINKCPMNKDLNSLSLCLISWLIWDSDKEVNTGVLLFDLNQWYKEQMPRMPNWSDCSNYLIKNSLSEFLLDVKMDPRSLSQFMGIQRLEEHFCPTSLSFDLWGISESSIFKVHNKGIQKEFLDKMANDSHLALVKPEDYYEQVLSLGLVPLFCDIQMSNSMDIDYQRELLLSVALEQKLIGWLCQAALKLANNAYSSSGLTIYNILNWALQRAVAIKSACDNYCVPLFDYSGMRLDDNTITLISCGTNQIRNLCSFYRYVSTKLLAFVPDKEALLGEQKSLENVVVYFEVLLWMVNIGLLPEYQPRGGGSCLLSAPYLVQDLTQHYNKKRVRLQMASRETFVDKDCLLFIDNLINYKGAAEILRQQWQEDGGSGLYPPPSLQSVLRTYLLNGPDVVFKHSLVTYTLLDIAMTVDEQNKVIKLLLKFPQIFDLTQSNMKIVQAFWHLDHDDYETALEAILDPCVLPEDLQHWHHSVMMRSLLLQDQSGLALLYLQIRKPSMQDEKDLLTVVSLLVSKNMLDEAFKFRLQHKGPSENVLLMHIFNECNKNELLHTLLYRRLSGHEEKAFFRYLQDTRNPRCADLKVFYYILRSRFLEAFDSYALTKRRQPDTQGLIGQRDASVADSVVKMFKTLLPDVNRNLVELVRKERTNLWKEVQKPTPLSVFVHRAEDQVRYKSSVIFAALAKAKETFNDTTIRREVVTEEMPFLRTPSVSRSQSHVDTPLLKPKVIEQNERGEEEHGPSPCKKLKLSPRASKASPVKSGNLSSSTNLNTPIVKRKKLTLDANDGTAVLPQSILKSRTILDDSVFDENTSVNTSLQVECEKSIRWSRLGLTPRRAVRTPLKSHVKFDDLRYSGSSAELSSRNDISLPNLTDVLSNQSKNSTASTTDDVFYSPNHSFEAGSVRNANEVVLEPTERMTVEEMLSEEVEVEPSKVTDEPKIIEEERDLSTNRMNFQSPRSRRSYKRSLPDSPLAVRSSPRLTRKYVDQDTPKPESPCVVAQKPRGRKSLSRALLEHNTFAVSKSTSLLEEPRKSVISLNTTFTDTNTDMDDSFNASLEAFLEKYEGAGSSKDSSFARSGSLADEAVVSKTSEFISVETRRESLRKANTGVLVSSNETRDEYRSKTVESFGEEDVTMFVSDKLSEPEASVNNDNDHLNKASEKDESLFRPLDDEASTVKDEEVDVYEDLSSASEDVKEVLRSINTNDKSGDVFSVSPFQSHDKDSGNIVADELQSEELPATEKAFVGSVIEISSSSEDSSGDTDVKYSENSRSNSNKSNCSNESVQGSYVSDESLNVDFQDNLNEDDASRSSSESGKNDSFDEDAETVDIPITGDGAERIAMKEKESRAAESNHEDSNDQTAHAAVLVDSDEEEMGSLQLEVEEIQLLEEPDNVIGEEIAVSVETEIIPAMDVENLDVFEVDLEADAQIAVAEEGLKNSVSLQCTLACHLAPIGDDSPVVESPEQSDKNNTPMVLRTVKKTYPARKTFAEDIDATPKLAVDLTQRTYSRKNVIVKLFNERKEEDNQLRRIEEDSSENLPQVQVTLAGDQDIEVSIDRGEGAPEAKHMKLQEAEDQKMEASESVKEDEGPSESKQEEYKNPEPREVEGEKTQTAPIMTRRLSLLLSQKDGAASSSLSEDSVVSRGSKTITESDFDQSEPSTSSSRSPVRPRRTKKVLSESMFDNIFVADTPEKRDVMETSLISTTKNGDEVLSDKAGNKRRDEEISNADEDAKEQELSAGSSRIYAMRSSKTSKVTPQKASRRTRSASVDQSVPTSARKKSVRSRSIDLDDTQATQSDLRVTLAPISEAPLNSSAAPKSRSKASSSFGDYTTSRRLTRRQATMLEAIVNAEQEVKALSSLDEIEPLNLLDKPQFEGQPDPEEAKVYERNSPSNSSETLSRHTRSASVLSDATGTSTPTKKRATKAKLEFPVLSGIKSRLRSQSTDTVSVASERSESPSTPKSTRKKGKAAEQEAESDGDSPGKSVYKTRSRAGSVSSSVKSDLSDNPLGKSKRGRRIQSGKSELPEIQEERASDEGNSTTRKGGRKRKKH